MKNSTAVHLGAQSPQLVRRDFASPARDVTFSSSLMLFCFFKSESRESSEWGAKPKRQGVGNTQGGQHLHPPPPVESSQQPGDTDSAMVQGGQCPGSLAGGRKRQFFHHEQSGKRATAAEKNHLVACAGCHFWKEQWNCHVITGISYTLSFSPHRESVSVIFRGNWRHRKIDAASARHSGQLLLRDISLRCAWQ